MFTNKNELDRHIKTNIAKLNEHERNQRGLMIARQYARIGEYASAEKWVCNYLSVKDDCAAGHKLLGQCYEKFKKLDRAIAEYQRSLQLDPKQYGLITEVCKLLFDNEDSITNLTKGKYWCDLADRERINNDAVLNLKLKIANKDNTDSKGIKDILLKEIIQRPTDPSLRIKLIKHFIDAQLLDDAFKYCYDIEMKFYETFIQSLPWYNTVATALAKYEEANSSCQSSWNYWLLTINTLERQIYLNLTTNHSLSSMKKGNIKDITLLLFEYDQMLKKCADSIRPLVGERELTENFLKHYRGQLCLHTASLIFKIETTYNKNRWRETTNKCLPLLLLAYQCGVIDMQGNWLKNTNDSTRNLCANWNKQGAFRCTQAGRTLFSCIKKEDNNSIIEQLRLVVNNVSWNTIDDLVTYIRQYCLDQNWRKLIYRSLYTNSDQLSKMATSYFVQSSSLAEPSTYEIPKLYNIEIYDEIAQYLYPSTLSHIVYLGLGYEDLANFKSNIFNKLNGTTNNLLNCSVETLNKLDIDTFMYAAIIETKSKIMAENKNLENFSYDMQSNDRPLIMPYPNMIEVLWSEEQGDWWTAAYNLCNNQTVEQRLRAQPKAVIEDGLEAVRCVGNVQKIDLIILFKLGELLMQRIQLSQRNEEKHQLEQRVTNIWKYSLRCTKNQNNGNENLRRLFKYSQTQTGESELLINNLSETAISYLAKNYFRDGKFEEYIEDFKDLDLPYATYFQAQAYRKLDESNNTPRKAKKKYLEKARESLNQTMMLLEELKYEKNHSLFDIIRSEINYLQFNNLNNSINNANSNAVLNISNIDGNYNNDVHQESFHSVSSNVYGRNDANYNNNEKTNELEKLILKLMDSLNIAKDDILNIRNDVNDTQDRLVKIESMLIKIEENTSKKTNELVVDDILNDYYPGYAGTQQQQLALSRQQQNQQQQQMNYQMYNTTYPMYLQNQVQPQIYGTPNQPRSGSTPINSQPAYPSGSYQQPFDPSNLLTTVAAQQQVQAALYQQQLAAQYLTQYPQQPQQPAAPQLPVAPQPSTPVSVVKTSSLIERALQTPSVLNTWNSTYNNTAVDKTPPVNVVITTSDPLPSLSSINSTTIQNLQPAMSVTIPAQHIKHGNASKNASMTQQNYNTMLEVENISPPLPVNAMQHNIQSIIDNQTISNIIEEVIANEGENVTVLFSANSKLFNLIGKEWKERGVGEMKILKNNDDGKMRMCMRDPSGVICANHFITPQMQLTMQKNQDRAFIYSANEAIDSNLPPQMRKCCVRFRTTEIAINFKKKFEEARSEMIKMDESNNTVSITLSAPKSDTKQSTKAKQQAATVTSSTLNDVSSSAPTTTTTPLSFGAPTAAATTASPFFGFGQTNSTPTTAFAGFATTATSTTSLNSNPTFGGFGKLANDSTSVGSASTFTFRNPTAQKTSTPVAEKAKDPPAKPSIFGQFSFGTDQSSEGPSLSLFSNLNKSNTDTATDLTIKAAEPPIVITSGTLNKSVNDEEDDYVPTAQFKPVIELPDLVVTKTGEEDEDCVFEHRAKLLRFVKETKEWKDRGIGNMKILLNKNDKNKVRLLMRRDQVLKLCCNQMITKDTNFTKKSAKALTWVGHDYSENELTIETLAIQFKYAETCDEFYNKITGLQKEMSTDIARESPPKVNTALEAGDAGKGFGDKFKPKAGSWSCTSCYTSNTATQLYCAACEGPKDSTVPKKTNNVLASTGTKSSFTFGIQPAAATASTTTANEVKPVVGFGNQFKPKEGSWSCNACYTSNGADKLYCASCESPKDDTVPKKPSTNLLDSLPKTSSFVFGVPKQTPTVAATATSEGSNKIVFGMPKEEKSSEAATSFTFYSPANTSAPFNSESSEESKLNVPAFGIGATEKGSFDFVFKPKSPGKSKSPAKNTPDDDNNHTDDEYHEEENNTYFTPAIPLPDKVEVKTGEEDEKVLYSHRAKLFRWIDNEWKERGLGDVKILRHNGTGKLRVVMRREQILKICLNHVLTPDVEYKSKDDKTWLFAVQDFSEGTLENMQFCIRFKTAEIATEFRDAIDTSLLISDSTKLNGIGKLKDEAQPTISAEDKKMIEKLRLPADFYNYKFKDEACSGCRGCNPDVFKFPNYKADINNDIVDENAIPIHLPVMKYSSKLLKKSVTFKFAPSSITNAEATPTPTKPNEASIVKNLFGTPPPVLKSDDSTGNIFGGKSLFGNSNSSGGSIFSSSLNTTAAASTTSTISSQSPFSSASTFGSLKTSPSAPSGNIFGQSFSFGNPSFSFGSGGTTAPTGNVFGGLSNGVSSTDNKGTNIFSGSNVSAVVDNEIDSIDRVASGADVSEDAPTVFGVPKAGAAPIFGGTPVFGSGTSIFGKSSTTGPSLFESTTPATNIFKTTSTTTPVSTFSFATAFNDQQPQKSAEVTSTTTTQEIPDFLKKDTGLSFASLATDDSISFLKPNVNGNGANGTESGGFYGATMKEDIFSKLANKKKAGNGEEANENDDSTASATDEQYDPHYEPIIQLPDEIVVSTGEENEEKLFGERGKLYRYDVSTKQWKERGVGEMKILHHLEKNTYRLLMRREQIHKLVLNHSIGVDFVMNPMNSSGNAFCWYCMNYAEDAGASEQLAIRFKNEDLANKFKTEINKCIDVVKSCADLEPEED